MSTTKTLTIGMIGAGDVAQTIARGALIAGHRVVLSNSRGPETLADLVDELGEGASAASVADAAQADVVFLAVGWDQVPAALQGLPAWGGRIVVDTTNQWHDHDPARPADLGEQTGSEHIAGQLAGARVVKAFNTVSRKVMGRRGNLGEGGLVIFLAGDDADARSEVATFVSSLGLLPIDLGGLRSGGRLMQAGGPLVALHLDRIA